MNTTSRIFGSATRSTLHLARLAALIGLLAGPLTPAARAQPLEIRKPGGTDPIDDPAILSTITMAWDVAASHLGDARSDVSFLASAGWKNVSDEDRASVAEDFEKSFGKLLLAGAKWSPDATIDSEKTKKIGEVYRAAITYLGTRGGQNNSVIWLDYEPPAYSPFPSCGMGTYSHHFVFYHEGGVRKNGLIYCWTNISHKLPVDHPQGAHSLWQDTAHEAIHGGSIEEFLRTRGQTPKYGAIGDSLPPSPIRGVYGAAIDDDARTGGATWLLASAYERFAIRRAYARYVKAQKAAGQSAGPLRMDDACAAHDLFEPPPADPNGQDYVPPMGWPGTPTAAVNGGSCNGGGPSGPHPGGGCTLSARGVSPAIGGLFLLPALLLRRRRGRS